METSGRFTVPRRYGRNDITRCWLTPPVRAREGCRSRGGGSSPKFLLPMKLYSFARWSLFVITLFWVAVIASNSSFSAREQTNVASKIAPWVLERTANGQEAEFLVVLGEQADLSGADRLTAKAEKGRFVRDALWQKAQETQGPLLSWLAERKIEHRAYYIVNLVWVKANSDVALALAARADVARIEGNPQIQNFPNPLPVEEAEAPLPNRMRRPRSSGA